MAITPEYEGNEFAKEIPNEKRFNQGILFNSQSKSGFKENQSPLALNLKEVKIESKILKESINKKNLSNNTPII